MRSRNLRQERPPLRQEQGVMWNPLLLISISVLPAMTLVWMGNYALAATVFYALFGIFFVRSIIRQDAPETTLLVLGCLPAQMLLREYMYYSSVEVLLVAAVGIWALYAREDFNWLFSSRIVQGLVVFVVIYWLISFARTGDYSENLRIFELSFAALNIRLLSRYRKYLATALTGIAISGFAIGVALSGQGDRLGMVRNEDARLGNPVTFGLPMALIVVLCLAEGGRWMFLHSHPFRRTCVAVVAGLFLLFSTSRGSWSVAAACIIVMLLFAPRRGDILRFLLAGTIGVSIWARFADTSTLEKYIYKTFYSEEEWSDVNARVAQWQAFPVAFLDSPVMGYGPGSGKGVSLRYSGHNLIWHSLYLHIGIECGGIGLLLLAAFLLSLLVNGFQHLRRYGEIAPLLGVVGFMTIAVSIPGIDGVAGLLLGMGLSGGSTSRYRIIHTVYKRTVSPSIAPAVQE